MPVHIERWNQVAGDLNVYPAIKKTDGGKVINGVAVRWTPEGEAPKQFVLNADDARKFGKAVLEAAEGQMPPEAHVN